MGSKQSQDGGYSATLCFYQSLNTNRLRNSLPNKYYNNQRRSSVYSNSSNNSTTSIARPGPAVTTSSARRGQEHRVLILLRDQDPQSVAVKNSPNNATSQC